MPVRKLPQERVTFSLVVHQGTYFRDNRLREYRNVANPHDRVKAEEVCPSCHNVDTSGSASQLLPRARRVVDEYASDDLSSDAVSHLKDALQDLPDAPKARTPGSTQDAAQEIFDMVREHASRLGVDPVEIADHVWDLAQRQW